LASEGYLLLGDVDPVVRHAATVWDDVTQAP